MASWPSDADVMSFSTFCVKIVWHKIAVWVKFLSFLQSYYRVHQVALKCATHWRQLVARRRQQASSVKTTTTPAQDISSRPSFSKPLNPQPSASYGPLLAR